MTYCFDLDETLCYAPVSPRDYRSAQPYKKAIIKVNELFDEGFTIVIFTGRGGTSGVDWNELTVSQLKKWGVKYHRLIDKGKPHYDLFVDDRATSASEWRIKSKAATIGFVASSFDLLHAGHCLFLKDARRVCDYLVAALQVDPNVDRPEKRIPIQSLEERRIQLEASRYVDKIYEYTTEKELEEILKKIKPDIRILGSDCKERNWLTGEQYCDQIYYHNRSHNWASTELLDRIKKS